MQITLCSVGNCGRVHCLNFLNQGHGPPLRQECYVMVDHISATRASGLLESSAWAIYLTKCGKQEQLGQTRTYTGHRNIGGTFP